jgi:hypothetical protein
VTGNWYIGEVERLRIGFAIHYERTKLPDFVEFTFAVVKNRFMGVPPGPHIIVMVQSHVGSAVWGWEFHRNCWSSNRRILQAAKSPGKCLGWMPDDSMGYSHAQIHSALRAWTLEPSHIS